MKPVCSRRRFLESAALLGGMTLGFPEQCPAGRAVNGPGLIDVNAYLSHWPLRRLPLDEPPALARRMKDLKIKQVWVGSFDALFHKDLAAVNRRLAAACREYRDVELRPMGAINPRLPDWEDEFRRCVEIHRMRGVRLHPNYHEYPMEDPALGKLLRMAAERRVLVQLVMMMEDERMMHPRWRVPPVDAAPLARVVTGVAGLQLMILNGLGLVRGNALATLINTGRVNFDFATLEGVGALERLVETVGINGLCFGTHAPLYPPESAVLKLKENNLGAALDRLIRENASRLPPGPAISSLP